MRVTDMRGVDIAKYDFDFDLTFSALTLHPDGEIYHRYGGRDGRSASHWTTEASFSAMLRASLGAHATFAASTPEREERSALTPESIPAFAKRDKGECIHCHNVHEAQQAELRADGTWSLDDIWVHPEPARIGIDLDPDDQRRVVAVEAGSPAAKAGLRPSDRLERIGGTPIASASDVMYALNSVSMKGGELAVEFMRDEASTSAKLVLEDGWRRGTPRSLAWRALKWTLDTVPGFGGPVLGADDRRAAGLEGEPFAFRINYFVTWGPRARYGRAAQRAGLAKGDVVYGVGEKEEFDSIEHFHAWWRLTREPGEAVRIRFMRDGQRREVELGVLD